MIWGYPDKNAGEIPCWVYNAYQFPHRPLYTQKTMRLFVAHEIPTSYRIGKRTEVKLSLSLRKGERWLRWQKMYIIATAVEGTETKKNINHALRR